MAEAKTQSCESCGATVYPEHIANRRAGRHAGQLLCPVCYGEKRREDSPVTEPESGRAGRERKKSETVSFSSERSSRIRTAGGGSMIGAAHQATVDDRQLRRALRDTGRGATRCRTFHAKLNESAIAYMNEQINAWVDEHPEVEIKFANTTVGVFEGKHADANLIITVFY